ncbi:MAG: TlpA family protein disulfide reductase [Crocinitomicaceae bacterium]|nr:TlpA family protein disulfide reductase [Crocinitomicaceae bacterium]
MKKFLFSAFILIQSLAYTQEVDKPAIDFEAINVNGSKINLSDFKGKVILLDFWASWCGPCRRENPNVVEAYSKYKKSKFQTGKGFEVISISLDRNEQDWKKAIETDGLIWKQHILDKGGKIARDYGVSSIPTAFLIDGTGKIVATGQTIRGIGLHLEIDKLLK